MQLDGNLDKFPLRELIEMVVYSSVTGVLELRAGGDIGRLFFRDGQPYHASAGERVGIGAVPPEESMRMLDQITPVEICTEATLPRAMLSSLLPNKRDFIRLTCCGVTMMRTGKNRLPLVQRLAVKVSELGESGIRGSG